MCCLYLPVCFLCLFTCFLVVVVVVVIVFLFVSSLVGTFDYLLVCSFACLFARSVLSLLFYCVLFMLVLVYFMPIITTLKNMLVIFFIFCLFA